MRAAALAYGPIGLAVFPVAADCRRPLTPHGCQDATTVVETIERWWARWPAANVAVACGTPSGVFALDIDVKGANGLRTLAELEAANGELPHAWRTATPSGGCHLWFRQPARALRNRVNFAPGLDVRTNGGSVAAPPSRKPNGAYHWEVAPWDGSLADAPDWLLNLIDPPAAMRAPRPPVRAGSRDRLANYVAAAIGRMP
jgi:putative DNA primase/helicase